MHRPANTGTLRRTKKFLRLCAWGSLGLLAGLTAAGCSSVPPTAQQSAGDPLLGPTPPLANQPTAPAAGNAQAWLAPIPPAAGVATNAALAGQSQSLAIGGAPSGDGWLRKIDAPPTPGQTPITPASQQSQPRVEPVPKDNSFTAIPGPAIQPTGSWAASSPPAGPSPEQLKQLLDARGVIGQKQEIVPGGILLRCVVTSPANPNANQVYETTAVDYATAVQAIVQQIDRR
jgi:hypothetical protein